MNSNDYKILIVDDSEMNRSILADILSDNFEILEAGDGVEAVRMIKHYEREISLILLDLVMPNMDGFEVLDAMNKSHWIEDIPVIMISAENSPEYIEQAYDYGVTDFINRPFNVSVVQKRVANTIMLYDKQRNLVELVTRQVYENEKNNNILINVLSHIVEFRNGESSLHVLRINIVTEILLQRLVKKTDKYKLTQRDIANIVTASSLHDIGKITVPDHIINKPGRLTDEEFEVIKGHSKAGADMLDSMAEYRDEPLVATARDICLYHHERYDGKGYPNGLSEDDIPISAQIVAVADVYDALTSERCYKKAYSHEKALEMIKNGECGVLNSLIVECLVEEGEAIKAALKNSYRQRNARQIKSIAEKMLNDDKFSSAKKSINMLEQSRIKYEFFASMSQEIQFEYTESPKMVTISDWGAQKLGLPTVIVNPIDDKNLLEVFGGRDNINMFKENMLKTSYENPTTTFDVRINTEDEKHWHKVQCRTFWSNDDEPKLISAIGKVTDIDDYYKARATLEKKASLDPLTGLFNKGHSKDIICRLLEQTETKYALCLFDLDNFKSANDTYGHMFGDTVLKAVASKLLKTVRKDDIVSRIGGDEFMVFIEYKEKTVLEKVAKRIFCSLNGIECGNDYTVGISMGITTTEDVGYGYTQLFNSADTALYYSKRNGRGTVNFYDKSMKLENNEA